jgi:crotonobetainyl-CoA:carnitine CoA-transferase CaiB-like acyl-CoA transferase
VIKVEEPNGDMLRKLLLEYDQDHGRREWSGIFEAPNNSKMSIVIDIKNEADKKLLLQLLEDADIFLTNLRCDALKVISRHSVTQINPF